MRYKKKKTVKGSGKLDYSWKREWKIDPQKIKVRKGMIDSFEFSITHYGGYRVDAEFELKHEKIGNLMFEATTEGLRELLVFELNTCMAEIQRNARRSITRTKCSKFLLDKMLS